MSGGPNKAYDMIDAENFERVKMRSSRNPLIYIAGPYTNGDVARNVRAAIGMADVIAELGGVPICPHLYHFWHLRHPHDYRFWTDLDRQVLEVCDAIYRLPGSSEGADKEVKRAFELKLTFLESTPVLMQFIDNWRETHG
jgi:hypothetical protein